MSAKMDANAITNGLEMLNNLTKIGANFSDRKKPDPEPVLQKDGDVTTSQPHNQTVEVKVGGGTSDNSNVSSATKALMELIKKKEEDAALNGIFPEGRELSERECEVQKLLINLEYENREKERQFKLLMDEKDRAERKEQEAYERSKAEERERRNRKQNRRLLIGAGVFGALGLGLIGYDIYTTARSTSNPAVALPEPQVIPVEGNVK